MPWPNVTVPSWEPIVEDYIKGRDMLWCPRGADYWVRDEDEGYYWIWKAYHAAKHASEKDHFWYARILYMMASEHMCKLPDDAILKRYADPCIAEYDLAINEGRVDEGKKEVEVARQVRDRLRRTTDIDEYIEKHLDDGMDLIEGHELLSGFYFHDSKPVRFMHDEKNAWLDLWYDGTVTSFRFENYYVIKVNLYDPPVVWIRDYRLYPANLETGEGAITLDLDYFTISSDRIVVERQYKHELAPFPED